MDGLLFVVPALGGHPSGGTLYNRALLRELAALGVGFDTCELLALPSKLDDARSWIWLDSLYLAELERVRSLAGARLGVLLHYLPSLLRVGDAALPSLDAHERTALEQSDALLLTSEFMQSLVIELGYPRERCGVVEPGCEVTAARGAGPPGVRALMVSHVVSNKGILEFLEALARRVRPADSFELTIVGGLEVEAAYAERCQALVRESPELAARVAFSGLCSHSRLLDELERHNLFVSASRMEAYGMALSEARSAGLPILARRGGNVAEHVAAEWGGELSEGPDELASACLRLARDPALERARSALARRNARAPRPWSLAAREFLRALTGFEQLEPRRQPGR